MKKKPPLSAEDQRLWDAVTAHIKPLRKIKKKSAQEGSPAPPPSVKLEKTTLPVEVKKTKTPATKPLEEHFFSRTNRRSLEKEGFSAEATLDLHGLKASQAHQALENFLLRSQQKGLKNLLIITGKGGAKSEGILRREVPLWLSAPSWRQFILSFDQAGIKHGGAGALYVRLRK